MSYIKDILQPWKLVVFAIGLSLLLIGVPYYELLDWDYGICFVMAVPTYLTAGWSMRQVIGLRCKTVPLAIFLAWFCSDATYAIYWGHFNPDILENLREASFYSSLTMYVALGLLLAPVGSLQELSRR